MAESSKTASAAGQSVLLPQGDHAGKAGLPLGSRPFTLIGSRNRAHLHLLSSTISRTHACIISCKSGMYVRDLASRTGVIVNSRTVKEMDLQDGDILQVGSFKFRFQEPLGAIHLTTTPRPPLAMLEGADGNLTPLDNRSYLIGRRPTCEILLNSATVSNTHAIIFECDGQRYIRDLGSRTGTQVNGESIHQQILRIGDQIRIGDTAFQYVAADAPAHELDEDFDVDALPADLIEDDELAPLPAPADVEQDELAPIPDVDDLAPVPASHPARPADPIVAEQMEHDAIPLATDDEPAVEPQELEVEQPVPVSQGEPAPTGEDEFVVADELVETQSEPIEFAEGEQTVATDLAGPVAEGGLTAATDIIETEDLDLDFWGPLTETRDEGITSETAHEDFAPVEPEGLSEEPEAIEAPQPEPLINELEATTVAEPAAVEAAQTDAFHEADLLDLEDMPGEYLPPMALAEEPVNEAAGSHPAFAESETSLAPSLEELEASAGEFDLLDKATPAGPLPLEDEDVAVLDESALIEEPELIAEPIPETADEPIAESSEPPHAQEQPALPAELIVEPAEVPAAEIPPLSADPDARIAEAEPITAIELDPALEAAWAEAQPLVEAAEIEPPEAESAGGTAIDVHAAMDSPVSQEQDHEIVIPPLEVTPPASRQDEEPKPVEAVVPLSVEKVDLSAVKFQAEPLAVEAIDASSGPQPESTSASQPLLDLTPGPQEIDLEALSRPPDVQDDWDDSDADEMADTATEPGQAESTSRKSRLPRKKPTATRRVSRTKKGEDIQAGVEAILAAEEDRHTIAPIAAQASPAEPAVIAGDVAPEPESVELKSEPIVDQAPSDELDTEAFYSGPARETPLVSVDAHSHPEVIDPATDPGMGSQSPEDAEEEILAFEAAATTPEAQGVMAAWQSAESDPIAFEEDNSSPTMQESHPALPAPTALTSDAAEDEPAMAEFSGSQPAPEVTAWANEDAIPLEPPPSIHSASADFENDLTASGLDSIPNLKTDAESELSLDEAPPGLHDLALADLQAPEPWQGETIEYTEPTVESALDLDPSLAQTPVTPIADDLVEVDTTLTDTAFGRVVNDFTGSGLGPLVEETPSLPQPALSTPDSSDSFDAILEDLPEFDIQEPADGEEVEYRHTDLLDAEVFEAEIDPGDLPAADLSSDLVGEFPAPTQTLTGVEIPDEAAAMDASAPPADVTLTTAYDIESRPTSQTADDAEFLPLGEDALIEPLEFDDEPASIAEEAPPPATKSPVAEVPTPAPQPIFAEPPKAAPPQKPAAPAPLNPYFGMERDTGSFLGGMPLSFATPLREPPRAPAPRQQSDGLPPPRLAPASPAESTLAPRSQLSLISPVAPIHGLAHVPGFEPSQTRAPQPKPLPAQPHQPVAEAATDLPLDAAEAEPATVADPDDVLFQAEEPLELFDGASDKLDELPEALKTIDDFDDTLAAPESPKTPIAPPLRSLTGGPGPAKPAAPAPQTITVPPFAGPRPNARGSVNPFAGMATPPPRLNTTDIFSQTAFPPPDEAMFQPQPIDIPPMTVRIPGVDASAAPRRPEPRPQSGPRPGQRAAPPAQGQIAAQAPHKPAAPTPPKNDPPAKKKWWQGIRLLLPLMLLVMSAAVVAIVRLFPPRTLVQGTLQIKGLDQLNPIQRKDQIRDIRKSLTKPDLRNTVVGSLQTQGISPGFTQDPIALIALSDPENSPSDRDLLVFNRVSTDPTDDQKRMQALLLAIYSESKTPTDGARTAGARQVKAAEEKVAAGQTEFDAEQAALQKLTDQLRVATGSSAGDVLLNPAAAVGTLQRQHQELGTSLTDANAKVKSAREALTRAQIAAAAVDGTPTDPRIVAMQQNLDALRARVASARVGNGPALETATQAFDDSLQSLDQDLMLVVLSARNNVASSYAAQARQASAEMRDLLSRQKQSRDDTALLRAQFAGRRETYLKQVWAADETLKGLIGARDAQAHRYATATDGSNADEIAAARSALDALDQKMDDRRKELATGSQYADDLRQKLQQAIDRLATDRQENERKMAADLALLDVPPANKLPANEQGSMASLGERVAGVQAARDQYAAASNAAKIQDSDGQSEVLQEEIAEQQARLDAYQQQVQADPPLLAKARKSLDAAQDAQAKAQLAYADNLDLLASARELTDAQARVAQARAALAAARTDLEIQRSAASNVVQLQAPDERSAQLIYEPDQRHWYVIGALGGLAALFAGPLWMGLREPQHQAPFASVLGENEQGDADVEDYGRMNGHEDEGHPATV